MLTDTIYQSLKSVPSLQRQLKRVVLKLPHRQRLVNHFQCKLWVDPAFRKYAPSSERINSPRIETFTGKWERGF